MTRYLSQALQDLVSDEPPMTITVGDVVRGGRQRERKRRRWFITALISALLSVPAIGLGVSGAMSGDHPSVPLPVVSGSAVVPSEPASPPVTQPTTPGTKASSAPDPTTRTATPSATGRPPATNYIFDPSFEATPTGWAKFKPETTVLESTDLARSGEHAVKVTTTSAVNAVGGVTSSPVQVTTVAGTTYQASCWVRAPVKVDAILQVQEYTPMPDKSWVRAGDAAKSPQVMLTDPQRWYEVSVTYTAQNTGKLLPLVVFSSWLRAGYSSLTVDDCSLMIVP